LLDALRVRLRRYGGARRYATIATERGRAMMGLSLRFQLICPVCQLERSVHGDAAELLLFGYVAFAVCPKCGNQVHDLQRDQNYRKRVRRFVAQQRKAAA
jgi:C4-type Zn-finger protein